MVPEFSLHIQSPRVSYERTVTFNGGSTCINRTAANKDGWTTGILTDAAEYTGVQEGGVITMPFHSNSFGNEGIRA